MQRRTPIFIVCSPHSRVGTTTTARLLADYFAVTNRPFAGFDTDPQQPIFANLFPRDVTIADIGRVTGQMAIYDRLLVNDEVPKIVDLWQRSYRQFFATIREIGLFEEARRLSLEPILLFQADPAPGGLEAAQSLAQIWPDVSMIVVNNEGAAPFGADVHGEIARYPTTQDFHIPPLDPVFRRTIETERFSLSRFLLAPPSGMSIVVRAGLNDWLSRIYTQFRSFELRNVMQSTQYLR
jgi:hypothetical protein